jgi:hypothetical protein
MCGAPPGHLADPITRIVSGHLNSRIGGCRQPACPNTHTGTPPPKGRTSFRWVPFGAGRIAIIADQCVVTQLRKSSRHLV